MNNDEYKKLLDAIVKQNSIDEISDNAVLKEIQSNNNLNEILLAELEILKALKVEFDEFENSVAHYTRASIALQLLQKKSKFRLSSISNVNDPMEGKVLFNYLRSKNIKYKGQKLRKEAILKIAPFVSCFTFNHDSLNQFRLYGKELNKEATGVSIIFNENFFLNNKNMEEDKPLSNLYRCIYLEPNGTLEGNSYLRVARRNELTFYRGTNKNLPEYSKKCENISQNIISIFQQMEKEIIKLFEEEVNERIKILLTLLLLPLNYLIKHSSYQEEQECRIIKFLNFSHSTEDEKEDDKKREQIRIDNNSLNFYTEYLDITSDFIQKIYLSSGATRYKKLFEFILNDQNNEKNKKRVKISSNPFRNT